MKPPEKRMKIEEMEPFSWEVIPVLSDEKSQDVDLLPAYAAPIFNKKETSRLVKEVAGVYPLKCLQHLKRVRPCKEKSSTHPLEILLCLVSDVREAHETKIIPSLSVLFNGSFDFSGLGEPFLVKVPAHPPLTRPQFEEAKCHWPTSFHEDKQITEAIAGQLFSKEEKVKMHMHMGLAIEAAKAGAGIGMEAVGAAVVQPNINEVLAVGHDCRNGINPLLHAVMVCIDLVASGQGGGVYSYRDHPACSFIPSETYRPAVSSSYSAGNSGSAEAEENGVCYICTGYDLFVTREPCVMCAMALVHSRIERVFYGTSSPDGALGTKYKIHTKKDLNHHYKVYKGIREKDCLELLKYN
ncbi:probable inactive tRNA-specific adenosine deaminase-like protein 3 [Protopterus annectens]|uniref:probable inactive tRNA-specific adenosine deaminase-like protein 3 n=1 Tax=Protopterus annectens TaxID=7888 RepID=UPI001CFAC275|nr:probable inactive tRNA-specific adenosine deaminase-like protein 3 [Protopterus annectens]